MSEWWTYSVADFLLFSPATYQRLFELHNRAVWPAHVLTAGAGMLMLAGLVQRRVWFPRAAAIALAAIWAWVAWAYHADRYAAINWAATYFAAAFALQGAMLALTAVVRGGLVPHPRPWARRSGATLLAIALFAMPALTLIAGRPGIQAEVFGIAPDPTAVGTLGILLATAPRHAWPLLPIPVLWCVVSGALLWGMGAPAAVIGVAAPAVALAWALASRPWRGSAPWP